MRALRSKWHATALTGMVLFGNLAQRTGRPIKWDTEQRTTNAMEAVALIWPLYRPTYGASRSRRLSSLVSKVISCPRPSLGSVDRV